MSKLVVVIQCDIVCKRCAGFGCMKTFFDRTGPFEGYPEDTRYMPMTCGGCCGAGVAGKLEDLNHKLARYKENKEDVVVHLASCMVSDNYHRPPCPFRKYIKDIVERKGYPVVLGSYLSKGAQKKRDAGIYKEWNA